MGATLEAVDWGRLITRRGVWVIPAGLLNRHAHRCMLLKRSVTVNFPEIKQQAISGGIARGTWIKYVATIHVGNYCARQCEERLKKFPIEVKSLPGTSD